MSGKEVAKTAPLYPALALVEELGNELPALIRDNIGPDGLSEFSFPRIKVPAGGGIAWTVPSLEGPQVAQELEGVIVNWRTMRAYWENPFGEGGGNQPPDCASRDGITGTGNPGGDCASCMLNEFGSKDGGRGKACKEVRAVFMLRDASIFPDLFPLPPMSIKPLKEYFLQLAGNRIPYWQVITRLKLETARNADGITYSKAVPTFVRRLTPEEVAVAAWYRGAMNPVIDGVVLAHADVDPLPFEA